MLSVLCPVGVSVTQFTAFRIVNSSYQLGIPLSCQTATGFLFPTRCTDRSRPLYDVVRGLTTQYVAASEIGSCFIEVAFSPFFVLNLCGIALETSRFDEGSTCTNMSIKNNEG